MSRAFLPVLTRVLWLLDTVLVSVRAAPCPMFVFYFDNVVPVTLNGNVFSAGSSVCLSPRALTASYITPFSASDIPELLQSADSTQMSAGKHTAFRLFSLPIFFFPFYFLFTPPTPDSSAIRD